MERVYLRGHSQKLCIWKVPSSGQLLSARLLQLVGHANVHGGSCTLFRSLMSYEQTKVRRSSCVQLLEGHGPTMEPAIAYSSWSIPHTLYWWLLHLCFYLVLIRPSGSQRCSQKLRWSHVMTALTGVHVATLFCTLTSTLFTLRIRKAVANCFAGLGQT